MTVDHYTALGLDRRCSGAQIRAAYRSLAKRLHPDVNPNAAEAVRQVQQLNAAHEILSDPQKRRAYDRERAETDRAARSTSRIARHISQDVRIRIEDLFRGANLDVRVSDPANRNIEERYELHIPAETAPGTRFRLSRDAPFEGGFVQLRLRVLPDFRFKMRGSDLHCEMRIDARRATAGGVETIALPGGRRVTVNLPPGVGRGERIRISGAGLPRPRGGRGDLVVRIAYRLAATVSRRPATDH